MCDFLPEGHLEAPCPNMVSLLWEASCPTSTTCTCWMAALHFMVYLGPMGTRLLISGGPLKEPYKREQKHRTASKREQERTCASLLSGRFSWIDVSLLAS